MAELDYDQIGQSDPAVTLPDLSKAINVAGALISLGLIAGLAWWGYQLVVRDVSGVPVVRALEGPMRVAPEDPGGQLAAHTGLAVNNIPAEGIAEEPAERLALAPAAQELSDEDQPIAVIEPTPRSETEPEIALATIPAATSEPEAVATPSERAPAEQSPVEKEIGDLISAALAEATGEQTNNKIGIEGLVSADLGGLTRSLVPLARPSGLAEIKPLPVASDGFVSIPVAEIPAGTRLAQIGAFDSQEIAMAEWVSLTARFPEYLTDKARVIETAQSGGKTFYRLRAHGFADLAAARRFCAVLVSGQVNCIPVRQR